MVRSRFALKMMTRLLPSVLAAILVVSCGYHLRGAIELPPGMEEVFIQGGEDDFEMRNALSQTLRLSGSNVVSDPNTATGILLLKEIKEFRDPVSFTINGDVARYRLELRVTFALQNRTDNSTGPVRTAKAKVTHQHDPAEPLRMEREQDRLFSQLRSQVSQSMLRLISKRSKNTDAST